MNSFIYRVYCLNSHVVTDLFKSNTGLTVCEAHAFCLLMGLSLRIYLHDIKYFPLEPSMFEGAITFPVPSLLFSINKY